MWEAASAIRPIIPWPKAGCPAFPATTLTKTRGFAPWIYEHPPATEDCQICHDPHGSVTNNMLVTVQPVICISCHSVNDQFHQLAIGPGILDNQQITQDFPTIPNQRIKPFAAGQKNQAGTYLRRCTDCHGAVHGSYTDEHLRH